MPWREIDIVELRLEFVMRALREEMAFRDLCQEYGISAKTGYKWKERFLRDGMHGLEDQSRRPNHSPQQVAEDVLCEIVRIKKDHKDWGPKKILQVYARTYPHAEPPSLSTVKRVLDKAGLVKKNRRRKSQTCGRIEYRVQAQQPNDLWTVDFKGWWYTVSRQRCEPLTVRDQYSRFVLCATPLDDAKSTTVRREFERLFECYGMPQAIRSDNGPPFACTQAPLGLSRLSAWWVTQGITLDRIPPARPDQNGAHERLHRDMRALQNCPEDDLERQRATIEVWRHEFNFERPHEALDMRVPGDVYQKSSRPFLNEPRQLQYPADFLRRRVGKKGSVRVENRRIDISTVFAEWDIGLKPCGADDFLVWFGPLCVGTLDLRTESFKAAHKVSG